MKISRDWPAGRSTCRQSRAVKQIAQSDTIQHIRFVSSTNFKSEFLIANFFTSQLLSLDRLVESLGQCTQSASLVFCLQILHVLNRAASLVFCLQILHVLNRAASLVFCLQILHVLNRAARMTTRAIRIPIDASVTHLVF